MTENQKSTEKMTLGAALTLIRTSWNKGLEQGNELMRLKEAYRVIIADRVRALRLSKKMTQEELSDKINTNTLTYRGYENLKSDIPIVYLIRIADLFDVSLDYLMGRTDINDKSKNDIEERLQKLEQALAQQNK